jgi:hypothetical protein
VSHLAPNSEAWLPFMRDVILLPMSMLPAAQGVVKIGMWRKAHDPLKSVRDSTERRAAREWVAAANGEVLHPVQRRTEREFIEQRLKRQAAPAYLTASEIAKEWEVPVEFVRRAFSDRAARSQATKYYRGSHPYFFRIPISTFREVRDELNAGRAESDRYPDIDPVSLTAKAPADPVAKGK